MYTLTHVLLIPHYASVNRVSIGSDNGLSPFRRQAIIQTIAGLLSIAPKLLRYLTTPADYLDARATKFQILKISYQLG